MRVALFFLASSLAASSVAATSLVSGCSSKSNGAVADAGGDECAPIDSACGQPCQEGNSLGIGKFCNHAVDCEGTPTPTLCATLGDSHEHFCTAMCSPEDAGPDAPFTTNCGENATCQCQGSQCGCFPTSCF